MSGPYSEFIKLASSGYTTWGVEHKFPDMFLNLSSALLVALNSANLLMIHRPFYGQDRRPSEKVERLSPHPFKTNNKAFKGWTEQDCSPFIGGDFSILDNFMDRYGIRPDRNVFSDCHPMSVFFDDCIYGFDSVADAIPTQMFVWGFHRSAELYQAKHADYSGWHSWKLYPSATRFTANR